MPQLDTLPETVTCPQCERNVRISEPFAFRGMSRTQMTLSCGHVVARQS